MEPSRCLTFAEAFAIFGVLEEPFGVAKTLRFQKTRVEQSWWWWWFAIVFFQISPPSIPHIWRRLPLKVETCFFFQMGEFNETHHRTSPSKSKDIVWTAKRNVELLGNPTRSLGSTTCNAHGPPNCPHQNYHLLKWLAKIVP